MSKVEYEEYLAHEAEPKRLKIYDIAPEIEDELLANRLFLKRRVWKNMEKIRRVNSRSDKHQIYPKNKSLELRYQNC